jgi:hypothetical protein
MSRLFLLRNNGGERTQGQVRQLALVGGSAVRGRHGERGGAHRVQGTDGQGVGGQAVRLLRHLRPQPTMVRLWRGGRAVSVPVPNLGRRGALQARAVAPFLVAVLAEIYLRNVCSCPEILRRNGALQAVRDTLPAVLPLPHRHVWPQQH